MNQLISMSQDSQIEILQAANSVIELQYQLIEAYKKLESVSKTNAAKQTCLEQAANIYTKQNILVADLRGEQITLIN